MHAGHDFSRISVRSNSPAGSTSRQRFSRASHRSEHAGLPPAAASPQGGAIGAEVADAIRASSASGPLPERVRAELTDASGHDFHGIAVHSDASAHRAAEQMNARAFTLGRRIYFARNEYQPTTTEGRHLLAHEAAHAVQQRGVVSFGSGTGVPPVNGHGQDGRATANAHGQDGRATANDTTPQQRGDDLPPDKHFRTTASNGREEVEAHQFADFIAGGRAGTPPPLTPSTKTGLVRRVIGFTHADDAIATNPITSAPNETADGFRLTSDPGPSFQWQLNVMIHGAAGDPFADFQVGFLQVERVFGVDIYWGSGANQTHRRIRADKLPRRDADAKENTFISDDPAEVADDFTADGEKRFMLNEDTPSQPRKGAVFPWNNPKTDSASTTGYFDFSDAFVTYISARNKTTGTFHDIANVYWNMSATGQFDTARPVGSRVHLTSGPVNVGKVQEGGSGEFPAMHGGEIANEHDVSTG